MEHAQALKYLHAAKEGGRATPVYSSPGGAIRGWVPAGVDVTETLAEQKARRAAAAVKELSIDGKPVSAAAVGRHLGVSKGTVARWLKLAETMKLVHSMHHSGWLSGSRS